MRKRTVRSGDVVTVELPFSEVCIHMGVAGKRHRVRVEGPGARHRRTAYILYDDGGEVPVTPGEAGIRTDTDGTYYIYE